MKLDARISRARLDEFFGVFAEELESWARTHTQEFGPAEVAKMGGAKALAAKHAARFKEKVAVGALRTIVISKPRLDDDPRRIDGSTASLGFWRAWRSTCRRLGIRHSYPGIDRFVTNCAPPHQKVKAPRLDLQVAPHGRWFIHGEVTHLHSPLASMTEDQGRAFTQVAGYCNASACAEVRTSEFTPAPHTANRQRLPQPSQPRTIGSPGHRGVHSRPQLS